MRNFRVLRPDEIECRINQVTEAGVGILLYKTARTDYALLDEKVGMYNWQNDYKVIDGKMYCGIGIKNQDGEWVWKWNCGVESNTEAEKGQASDAMKRAGFCWGIGTELYSAPFIWVGSDLLDKKKNGKVYDRFFVKKIDYGPSEEITALEIVNDTGRLVYSYPKNMALKPVQRAEAPKGVSTQPNQEKPADTVFVARCAECNAEIGKKVHDYSVSKYGRPLCMNCQTHARPRSEATA